MNKLYTKLFLAALVITPGVASAASPFLKPVKDVLGDAEIFIKFLNWALPAIGILIFFLLIIYFIAGKMHLSLPGMGEHGPDGKALFWSVVALAVMFAVYGLIQLIGALFGIDTNRAKTITAPSLPQVGGVQNSGYYYGNGQ